MVAGNDTIDGGDGTNDTACLQRGPCRLHVALSGSNYTVTDNRAGSPDGTDTVTNVENFQFSDGTVTAAELNAPVREQDRHGEHEAGQPESEWGYRWRRR